MSHEEFQIICVDIPPLKHSFLCISWAVYSDFLPKSTVWKGGKKRLTEQCRNLTNTTSSYTIKVNINSDRASL